MSNQHVLKIHPAPLADLLSGAKTAEVRRNDRGFQVGDTVRLMEVNPETGNWTGAADHVRTISHIQTGYGLPDGICVLSYTQPFVPRNRTAGRLAIRAALPDVPGDMLDHGLFAALDAMGAQAEQQEAREPVLARPEHGVSLDVALALTMDRYSGAMEKLAASEQQEASGTHDLDAVAEAIFNADKDNWYSAGPYPQLHANDKARLRVMARAALATQPAAGEPDSSNTFYAGLYHKSSPMWHQLHELAESKGYDHVRYAIECAPVYKCDCRGARKVALDLEGRTMPCECVDAANDAPPAAAHGDEAVRKDAERYRFLKDQGHFRTVSIDMGGNNTWTGLWRGMGKGSTVDEAIDAAMRAQGDGEVQ